MSDGWVKKRKGSADIYTHPKVENAVVDRRGMGMNSSLGASITYLGMAFPTVREAKEAALQANTGDQP